MPLPDLWPRLTTPQQQALLKLLGELIHRQLGPAADPEVGRDPR
jgi:hypothetical protein